MGKSTSHLRGTFATVHGFIGDAEDLLSGAEPFKERLRFFIDTASKKPEVMLISTEFGTVVDPRTYTGGFELGRRLRLAMSSGRGKNRSRSSRLGFEGSGKAMGYTMYAPGGGRKYVTAGTSGVHRSLRAVVTDLFESSSDRDYVSNFGKSVETPADRAADYALIVDYLDQHGI